MARFDTPLAFPLGGDLVSPNTCWEGALSTFEEKLLVPLQDYALEQLRARLMTLVVAPALPVKAARTVFQMALETEMRAVLTKLIEVDPDVATSNVCERRRYLQVDIDMRAHHYLIAPAFTALAKLTDVPAPYADLVRRYGRSAYPRYRVAALAATLCLAAAVGA